MSERLEYKGYTGEYSYDKKTKTYYASVDGAEDYLFIESKTFEELRDKFEDAIEKCINKIFDDN